MSMRPQANPAKSAVRRIPARPTPAVGGNGVDNFKAIVKSCGRKGDVLCADEVVHFIEASGRPPPKEFYDILIHTCAQAKDADLAEGYFERMIMQGCEPTRESYNSVINACASAGEVERALTWLRRMIEAGMVPNGITYGTICKAIAPQGRVQEIEDIMRMVVRDGGELNEYFYASLITACGAANPPDPIRAMRAFADLVERGLKPKSVRTVLQRAVGEPLVSNIFNALAQHHMAPASKQRQVVESLYRARANAGGGMSLSPSAAQSTQHEGTAQAGLGSSSGVSADGAPLDVYAVAVHEVLGTDDDILTRYVSRVLPGTGGTSIVLSF